MSPRRRPTIEDASGVEPLPGPCPLDGAHNGTSTATACLLSERADVGRPPVLEARDLEFRYPDGTLALRHLSAAIPSGQRVAVLGANGCGKTTLFLHFCGIHRPTAGEVRFQGQPVAYTRAGLTELRRRVGIVFQDPDSQLFASSVRQDISFGPMNLGWPPEEVRRRVEQVIQETQIGDLADKPTHLLSYGQKKRVAIAGVLVMQPSVIIADEPTAGLDPEMTTRLLALLNRLHAAGTTIVISTHDVELALAWADHVIVLQCGRVLTEGRPERVFEDGELLQRAGLALPLLAQLFAGLHHRGLVPATATLPRDPLTLVDLVAGQVNGKIPIAR